MSVEVTSRGVTDGLQARLGRSAIRGGLSVIARSIAVRGVSFLGLVLLARLATPGELGTFVIVTFAVGFLGVIGDAGFAGALIQQEHEPSDDELSTVFTVQMGVALGGCALGIALFAPITASGHVSVHAYLLVLGILACLPISVLKAVPAARLERGLRYPPLATVDVAQAVVYQGLAVALTLAGFGTTGFVIAALAQATVGSLVVRFFSPWWVRAGIDRSALRRLLSFGVAYQTQTTVNYVKDSVTPVFVGLAVGASAVGYLNWAATIAAIPLLIAYPLSDVTFSIFARARGNAQLLQAMVERSIKICAYAILPAAVLTIIGANRLVEVVFGSKWQPAWLALVVFSFAICTSPLIASSFFSLFYATGRARLAVAFTVAWTVVDWSLSVPLVLWLGFTGVAWRSLIVAGASTPVLVIAVKSIVPIRVTRQILLPAALTGIAGSIEWFVYRATPANLPTTVIGAGVAGLVYLLLAILFERPLVRLVVTALREENAAKTGCGPTTSGDAVTAVGAPS